MRFSDRIASRIGGCALFGMLAVFSLDGCLNAQSGGVVGSGGAGGSTSRGGSGGTAAGGSGGSAVGGSAGSGGAAGQGGSAAGGATNTGGTAGGGGSAGGSGGASAVGGSGGTGGKGGSATGGSTARGGNTGTGGTAGRGGSTGAGGTAGGSGGTSAGGASGGRGGSTSTGGTGAGGSTATGGSTSAGGTTTGGSTGTGGAATGGSTTGTGGRGGTGGTSAGGSVSDGCGSELANNLTLSQVAVYQVVKIPVMKSGAEVAVSARNAHVVQGHDTMFRLFVTPGGGWTARELSGRVTLTPTGGSPTVYYSKKSISAASTDADQNNSFQITVPASAMVAPMTYSAEVVECGTQSGSPGAARFPTTGDIDLGVKSPGGLKITVIPLKVGSLVPDTSETALAGYISQMTAMYPANTVTMTVGTSLNAVVDGAGDVDWEGMLDQVQSQRTTDKPANDVYYFGLVKPADTFRNYCSSSCVTGIGFVVDGVTGSFNASARAAVGVGYADKYSYTTMAHEVGHNHGREHAPCSVSPSDPSYPYSGGLIGTWGYDARSKTLFDPAKYADIMSYCNNQWVSDYTYRAFTTRVAGVNGVALSVYTPPEALSNWRILRVSAKKGPRWAATITDAAPTEGNPEMATIQDAAGRSIATVTVYRIRVSETDAAMVLVPEPQTGWYAITVAGAPAIPFEVASK